MERECGWYWVEICGEWECAKYIGDDRWVVLAISGYYPTKDFSQIGPRITPPEESADAGLLEALELADAALMRVGCMENEMPRMKMRAAIAKATGETK